MAASDCFSNSPLFEGFTEKGKEFFLAGMIKRRFSDGEFVYNAGEPGVGLYILSEGELEVILPLNSGGESVLCDLKPGDHFGDITFLAGGEHISSVRSKGESEIMILTRNEFLKLQKEKPQTCLKLLHRTIHIFAQRLRKQQPLFERLVATIGEF